VSTIVRYLLLALVALALLTGGYLLVKRFFTAGLETEVKLGNERGRAGAESGSDAVDTVVNRGSSDQELLSNAQEVRDEINSQTDAAGVTGAGRRGLCDRAPDRRGCGGVQRPPAG
jgi:hypothetical protein